MLPEWLKLTEMLFGILLALVTSAIGVTLYIVRQRSGISREISESRISDREKIEDLAGRMASVERQMERLEVEIAALPSKEEFSKLHIDLIELKGLMQVQAETMRGQGAIMERIERIVERHEDHLLDKGAK